MTDSVSNIAEYSVSEVSFAVKRTVEDAFGYVRVRGEISGYRGPHSSGHAYFALKDEKARIEAVIWRGVFSKLAFKPEEGMEVVASGKITTYPGSSKYQIVIDQLEPAGVGALMALVEERRRKLAAEGLFDDARKQLLPYLPRVIGVVTSPTGAVIRDILHRLADRFPVHVLVWPVRVQGETCGPEVATAIRGFNAIEPGGPIPRPDLLIVARGGGSLEDLWGFNDEVVVRAAADSMIPLISAVGHETDWTLIDHAADLRAPTPTGAAEMAVPVRSELLATIEDLSRRHAGAMARLMEARHRDLRSLARALPKPDDVVAVPRQRFDAAAGRLSRALGANTQAHTTRFVRTGGRLSPRLVERLVERLRQKHDRAGERAGQAYHLFLTAKRRQMDRTALRLQPRLVDHRVTRSADRVESASRRMEQGMRLRLERARQRFDATAKLMETLSYKNVLKRGFALVRDDAGKPVRAAAGVASGSALEIEFADGRLDVVAAGGSKPPSGEPSAAKPPSSKSSARKPAAPKKTKPEQGSLF
ncbi:MAG: exodeoxyribonuclease VII large subunit [Hyphomicrobiales bacterium]|nr:MAG: exodeoxyribonuclease VII large subunit [Hyphomicrobiales bacterium]